MALKKYFPDVRFANNKVSVDEIDRYEVYTISHPGVNVRFWASAGTAGTAASTALTILNRIPDYPRNIGFILAGSSAGLTGTLVVNGYDQFGSAITEEITYAAAQNGGTAVGTKVFAQLASGTLNYGTAVGAGTPQIGFVPGTNCLFGLPSKIAGTSDVVHIGFSLGTGAVSVGGGTIAAFVDSPMHAVRAAATLDGTASQVVWYKPSLNTENLSSMAGLTQAV